MATALWGGIGVGLGTIVRNQIAAVIGLLAWAFVVENLLFALVPSRRPAAPDRGDERAARRTRRATSSRPPRARALLVAWVAVLVVAGAALTARRDVS